MDKQREYQIKIKGILGDIQWDWLDEMNINISNGGDFGTTTTITGTVEDQALLHGILYRLYSLGYVLISVSCLEENERKG